MKKVRVAREVGLLSLPDDILAKVAFHTLCWGGKERYSHWVSAAMTCKRLRDVQLSSLITVRNWKSLKWHLKRSQHVKHVTIMVETWPNKAHQRRKLSKELMEISCNLKHLEHLDLYPVGKKCPVQLEDWITGMLSGASSLKHARLHEQLLQRLPLSRRAALRSLHLEVCLTQARAVPDVVQAVLECQQLEELTIDCLLCCLEVPVLDLRHLVHLRKCNFSAMPAPGSLSLSQGAIDLSVSDEQVAAWSRLQHQISVGSWKILDLQSKSTFKVAVPDVTAFLKGIGAFCFKFKSEERQEDLIDKLEKAGLDTGTVLYEHVCNSESRSPWIVLSNTKPEPSSLPFFEEMYLAARIKYEQSSR